MVLARAWDVAVQIARPDSDEAINASTDAYLPTTNATHSVVLSSSLPVARRHERSCTVRTADKFDLHGRAGLSGAATWREV
jgi:hypothetical protein